MVTYFDKEYCKKCGCVMYDPDAIVCCNRHFKDPLDDMLAVCEPKEVQDGGLNYLLHKSFS